MATATATVLPTLAHGPVALRRLRAEYERAVERALAGAAGADSAAGSTSSSVALVVAPRLATLLAHVFADGLEALARGAVAECVELADDVAKLASERVVYLSFASADAVRDVAVHAVTLLEHRRTRPAGVTRLHLYAAGQWTAMCDHVLEGYGVSEYFQIGALPLGFVPLDADLLTLGLDRCLYDCSVGGNASCLTDMALAVDMLQRTYGKFEQVKYKGELSMQILNHLVEMNAASRVAAAAQSTDSGAGGKTSRLHTLIMLDRSVDYASALSTPLTYEALLDELMGIQDGFLPTAAPEVGYNSTGDAAVPATGAPIGLNSTDSVFSEIRSMHVHTVAASLNARAMTIKEAFSSFQRNSPTASAEEIQAFVKEVPNMKTAQRQLEQHIDLLETVETVTTSKPFHDLWTLERAIMDDADNTLDKIEAMIFRHEALLKVLRVLCLFSVVNDGLVRQDLERMKLHLVRAYGHELVFSFDNLEQLGLLKERSITPTVTGNSALPDSESAFRYVSKMLSVIDLDIDVQHPKSAAFVTGGYLPISCRLVEEILKNNNWRAIDQTMERLPGPRAEVHLADTTEKKQRKMKRPMTVVFFVGGVSYLEVAALRWIASFCEYFLLVDAACWCTSVTSFTSNDHAISRCAPDPVELIIATTSLDNGNTFLTKVLEHLPLATR
jgi:hypothetical protein